jgi:hypothetical protein
MDARLKAGHDEEVQEREKAPSPSERGERVG